MGYIKTSYDTILLWQHITTEHLCNLNFCLNILNNLHFVFVSIIPYIKNHNIRTFYILFYEY